MKRFLAIRTVLAALVLGGCVVSTAAAQPASTATFWTGLGPLTVEGYHTHYRLDTAGDKRISKNGIGGRLMWRGFDVAAFGSFASRAAAGLFAEYAPTQDGGFTIVHAGVQGDVHLLREPLFGRVMPLASLAAGGLWTDVDGAGLRTTDFPLGNRSTGTFALTPSLGTRIGLWRQLGMRVDVRDVVTFRPRTLHNWQFASGLSFTF